MPSGSLMFNIAAMDISTDLTELERTPATVVSAGIKSILDIGRTLEYLVRVCHVDIFNILFSWSALWMVVVITFVNIEYISYAQ